MIKKFITILWILWLTTAGIMITAQQKKTIIPLPEIIKPTAFLSDSTQFYIVEEATYYIYQWQGSQFKKKVGQAGEGPQEFDVGFTGIRLSLHPTKILVYTQTKTLEYQKDGSYIKEYRFPFNTAPFTSSFGIANDSYKLGNFFIKSFLTPGLEDKGMVSRFLCDSKFNQIRELNRFFLPLNALKKEWYVYFSYSFLRFYNEMAFISIGDNIELIGINAAGKTFLHFKYPYQRIKITDSDIQAFHTYFKTEHPNKSRYDRLKNQFIFPDYFPAIKNLQVADERIFVQTFKKNEKKDSEFLIFDLKGKYLKTIWLPVVAENLEQDYIYVFRKDQFAQLIENLDSEQWELHVTPF